jgi:hypothetical protein
MELLFPYNVVLGGASYTQLVLSGTMQNQSNGLELFSLLSVDYRMEAQMG